jgi:hypothetical protein
MPTKDDLHDTELQLFRNVISAVNAEDAPWPVTEGFENYWKTEQRDIRNDFRDLASHGRLSSDAAEWATAMLKEYSVAEHVVTLKGGHATISYAPKFKNFEASVAYVLLRLSAASGVHFGVCRKCGDLWYDDSRGKGRKREGFCSDAHRVAYNMAQYRKTPGYRRALAKAAKHK